MNKQIFEESTSDSAGWITTFADLMTLLLVFFILMFSMSSVKSERFVQAMESIQLSLQNAGSLLDLGARNNKISVQVFPSVNPEKQVDSGVESEDEPSKQIQTQPSVGQGGDQWTQMANTLQSRLNTNSAEQMVKVSLPKDGVISIQIQGSVIFDSGSTYLNSEVDPIMDTLLELFDQYRGYSINIKGHTDNIPISTDQYESNWELSAIRATTVLRYFASRGINPRRFTATGYGDSVPLASNSSAEGRSENRRIEFVLERQENFFIR
ncbi:flagellar motor protein MotB [Motiliproteus sp. MSK22-1]|uniref:OmpA/MotB family protein n=1 Tax=Motiliproteus sp. MSK22-1 TaxID=1897630 RepID=UPI0009776F29|nr:flagellar motor protein MotB [Motiliproteus sp. MSK22-1]OMH36276.1 hypothetical protein BGP75_10045 [Motiliproteus sp. MSK22-1]